jgi:hypothetical protein
MSTATNVTWASAIKNQPNFKKSTKSIGSFASIIDDPSFHATTCLRNLGNGPDPIIIFPSAIDQRPLAIHNIKDLGSTRINPDPIPFVIAGFGSSPVAVTFNLHALFRKTMNPIAVPKNLEDLLKLDSIKCLSDLENHPTPAPTQPPTAAPAISTRSKPASPEPETDPQVNEGGQESDKDSPTISWKTDFVPRQACLLPPTMFDIVTDIPSNQKKLFLALRTRVESLAFGSRNNHEDDSSSDDDSSTNSDSSNQSTIPTAHDLATYTYTLQYAFCLARGHLEGASIEPCTSGPHNRRLKEMTRLRLT